MLEVKRRKRAQQKTPRLGCQKGLLGLWIEQNEGARSRMGVLNECAGVWDTAYPMISKSWRKRWNKVIFCSTFSPEIRKAVYNG
jgi:transposase-like protein